MEDGKVRLVPREKTLKDLIEMIRYWKENLEHEKKILTGLGDPFYREECREHIKHLRAQIVLSQALVAFHRAHLAGRKKTAQRIADRIRQQDLRGKVRQTDRRLCDDDMD